MEDSLKIYVDQLRNGEVESLFEEVSPEFLDVHEKDLKFIDPVSVSGEAYLAEDMLVLHLNVKTTCQIPCLICNEPVKVKIAINGAYHAIPLTEIKGRVYQFREILREMILLEVPNLAECNLGNCPQRNKLQKYLKEGDPLRLNDEDEDGYRPFADLDLG